MLLKKIVLTTCLITLVFAHLIAQSVNEPVENTEKNVLFGFSIGLNQAYLLPSSGYFGRGTLSNNLGFRMGFFSEFKLVNHLAFAPKISLSLNNADYKIKRIHNNKEEIYYNLPSTIDLAAHFLVKTRNAKWMPYFIGGPCYQVPINKKTRPATDFGSNANLSLDLGIGVERVLTKFKIAPEIKYSMGLIDVSRNPEQLREMIFNNFSLVLNIKG